MASQGRKDSYWVDSVDLPRFPALTSDIESEVCVVGAGIVGVTTALLLKRAGLTVTLLEMDQVLQGTTGFTTGKISSTQGSIYQTLIKEHGAETATAYAASNESALSLIRSFVNEGIDCDFVATSNYVYATTEQGADTVRKEAEAAEEAGLEVVLLDTVEELPFSVSAALRHDNQAQFHPLRYLRHLLVELDGDGAAVFERSRVVEVDESDPNLVKTDSGSVTCRDVVIATGYPILDRGLYFARVHPKRSYAISGVVPRERLIEGMHISADQPTRSLRTIDDGDRILLLVGGEGHAVGQDTDTEGHYQRLETWAREHFDMREVTHRWATQDGSTVDSVPYIGTLRRGSDHLFVATGFGKWGMTNGTVAAMLISDLILGNENPFAPLYDPHRLSLRASMSKFVVENVKVASHFLGDRFFHPQRGTLSGLKEGEAAVAGAGLGRTAAYRDEEGRLHAVSAICTHLGCVVNWNPAEKSWDCPCHGSRFDPTGKVLQGPAVRDLEKKDVADSPGKND